MWGPENGIPIIGLHGWLDNASTFDLIAPYLSEHPFVSIDLAGHGHSDHLPQAASYSILGYASQVIEFAKSKGWEQYHLLGHSLGACIATIISGAVPDRIASLALIEGLGPLSRSDEELPEAFKKYLSRLNNRSKSRLPSYTSVEAAAEARHRGTAISIDGARILAKRGTLQVDDKVSWRTDARLTQKSKQRLTEKQVTAFLTKIASKSLLIRAESGLNIAEMAFEKRIAAVQGLRVVKLPGQHHLHLDDPEPTGELLRDYFKQS